MYLDRSDWDIIYDIESRANKEEITNEDVKVLLKLIRKMNGNIFEPRIHDEIQRMIDTIPFEK